MWTKHIFQRTIIKMGAPVDAHHVWAGPARIGERKGREAQHLWWFSSRYRPCVWWSHTHTNTHSVQSSTIITCLQFFFFFFYLASSLWWLGIIRLAILRLIVVRQQTWRSVTRLGRGEVVLVVVGGVWVSRECLVPAEEWTRLGWGQRAMWQRQPTDADGDPWKTSGECVCVYVCV